MPKHQQLFNKRPLVIAIHLALGSMIGMSPLTHADPQGGVVVGGTGTITQTGPTTTINQSSQNMAINWQSYNLNTNETVQYLQPNSSSVSLNRILSNNGSTIAGRIDANGRVILVNPNGILFTPTASLNVGSLIASGLDINPDDFMNGNLAFQAIDGTNGTVVNQGLINASTGGNAALIGQQVRNDGVIVANLGTVTLAAGKEAVLTFDNEGLLGVKVTQAILQEELGLDPAVLNNGTIEAQGGKVLLTASQSQDIFSQAVNTQGIDQATSVVVNPDGTFTLGDGADVLNTGTIDTSTTSQDQGIGRIVLIGENVTSHGTLRADAQAGNAGEIELHARDMTLLTDNSLTSARAENGEGGTVKVLGDKVGVFDQSTLDVSGTNGGGKALIGGDFQGKNTNIRNASHTIVDRNTSIYADAINNGNGGEVIVWADGTTQFLGNIFTRGGAEGGNGGFVEVSGKESLMFRGNTDRSAVNGQAGTLLLDPRNLTIGDTNTDSSALTDNGRVDFNECTGAGCDAATDNFSISAAQVIAELGNGSVTLQALRDIFVTSAITASAGNNNSLTLEAGNYIRITGGVNLQNGDITLIAGSTGCGVSCQASSNPVNVDISGTIDTTGSINITAGNDVLITSAVGGVNRPSEITIDAARNIQVQGDITTNNGNFTATATNGSFSNQFSGQNINTGNGNVTITANGSSGAQLGNIVTSGTGSLAVTTSGGDITQSTSTSQNLSIAGAAAFNAGANAIDLQNASNNLQGTIALTTTGTGNNATLRNDPSTGTTTLGATTVAGNLTINADNSLTLAGNVTADNITLTIGADAGSTFNANAVTLNAQSGAGVIGTITINGGSGNDVFNLGTDIAGSVNGNDGADTFNITAAGVDITGLSGGNGYDTLNGFDGANSWQVNGDAAGGLNVTAPGTGITFTFIQELVGGSETDAFTFNANPTDANIVVDGGTGPAIDTVTFTTAANVVLGNGEYTNIETYAGNGASTLTASDTINTWSITGTNAGNINDGTTTTTFSGFNLLIGGTNNDTFTLAAPNAAANIQGGTGTDTLVGFNATNTWTITAIDTGNVSWGVGLTNYTTVFTDIDNLTGGGGIDRFSVPVNPASVRPLSGVIDGGLGADTVTLSTGNATVQIGNTNLAGSDFNVTQVETISGNGAEVQNNVLIGDNTANSWIIDRANGGTLNSPNITFNNFGTVVGGSAADTFTVSANISTIDAGASNDSVTMNAGVVTTINLGAGNDQFVMNGGMLGSSTAPTTTGANGGTGDDLFSVLGGTVLGRLNGGAEDTALGDRVTLSDGATVNIGSGISLTGVSIDDIEGVVSQNGTLNARDGYNTTWTVDGENSGNVVERNSGGATTTTLSFTGFTTLNGSAGNDTFNIATNTTNNTTGSITGAINGNGGTNALDVSLNGNEAGRVNYVGNTGTDTVTITGTPGTYNASYTPDATAAGDQLHYVSSTNATYTVNYQGVDSIQTNRPVTTLTVNGTNTNDTVTLNNASFGVNTHTPVNYTNATNLTVNTQAGTDTIALNGLNLGSGTVTLTAEQVTGTGPTAITANTLILQDVGAFGTQGNQIQTSLNSLTLANTGDVHINEANGLTLNTTGNATNTGQFTIEGLTTFNTGAGGSLTLNNTQNDFDTINTQSGITAAALSLTDANRLEGGNLSAQAITLNTQTGIASQGQALNTQTANLTIHNQSNGVYLHNDQVLNANITNRGDINLTNLGNLTVERLYANGEDFQSQGPYAGDVVLNVQGHINAYQGPGAHSATSAPDIVAENLTVTSHGDFGNPARAMSILVNNTFAFFGQRGYVFYYGQRPQFTIGADDLVLFSGLTALQGQQLIEIESLEDIDPAIFTAIRNYYHEDVAILMPEDQRIDGVDEESEKERQGAPEVPQETQERGAEAQESNKVAP